MNRFLLSLHLQSLCFHKEMGGICIVQKTVRKIEDEAIAYVVA